jgi:hypothetical protein
MKAEPVQAFAARTRPRQNPGVLDGTIQRLPHAMDRQTATGHNDMSGLPDLASTLQIVMAADDIERSTSGEGFGVS